LGYEWSSAKGNEGIHYLTSRHSVLDTESITNDFDEEDKRILENLQGLKSINTPLYNPQNSEDKNKINKIIKDNFSRHSADLSRHSVLDTESKMLNQVQHDDIPEALKPFVTRARLVDMLDFSRVDFNKALSLTPSKKVEIESKYPLIKLDERFEISKGKSITQKDTESGNIKVVAGGLDFAYFHNVSNRPRNIITVSASGANAGYVNFWNEEIFASDCTTIYNKDVNFTIYAYNVLKVNQNKIFDLARGSAQPHVYPKDIESFKIPLPPLEIQEEIVKECQKVDDDVQKANETIQKSKQEIIDLVKKAQTQNTMKLGEACDMKAGKFVSASDIFDQNDGNLYPCFGGNGQRGYTKTFTHEGIYPLIGRQGALCGNITLAHGKFHATEHAVAVIPKIELDVIWLYYKLIIMNLNQYKTGTAQPGLSVKNINNVNIEIPPLETQKQIVSKIEALESKINEAKKVIDGAKEQKEAILKRHLF